VTCALLREIGANAFRNVEPVGDDQSECNAERWVFIVPRPKSDVSKPESLRMNTSATEVGADPRLSHSKCPRTSHSSEASHYDNFVAPLIHRFVANIEVNPDNTAHSDPAGFAFARVRTQ